MQKLISKMRREVYNGKAPSFKDLFTGGKIPSAAVGLSASRAVCYADL